MPSRALQKQALIFPGKNVLGVGAFNRSYCGT
jgi:hypothetical protein